MKRDIATQIYAVLREVDDDIKAGRLRDSAAKSRTRSAVLGRVDKLWR